MPRHAMPFLALSLSFAHAHALSRVHLISFAYSDIEFDSTHSQCGRMCIVCVCVCVIHRILEDTHVCSNIKMTKSTESKTPSALIE